MPAAAARAALLIAVVSLCACTENKRLSAEIKTINAKVEQLNFEIRPLMEENGRLTELLAVAHSNMRNDNKGGPQSGKSLEAELATLKEQESARQASLDELQKDMESYKKRFLGN